MNLIEKRARELLAAQQVKDALGGSPLTLADGDLGYEFAIRAIIAALTPPDGYVAAPKDPSLAMTAAGQLFGLTPNQACVVYQTMLAARPEVES